LVGSPLGELGARTSPYRLVLLLGELLLLPFFAPFPLPPLLTVFGSERFGSTCPDLVMGRSPIFDFVPLFPGSFLPFMTPA
jgi:hypothetical protein